MDILIEDLERLVWEYIPIWEIPSNKYYLLSQKFLNKERDWIFISLSQTLSKDFIRRFQDKLDWRYISNYQSLPENFIREFQDKVYWYGIFQKQMLSASFVKENRYRLYWP